MDDPIWTMRSEEIAELPEDDLQLTEADRHLMERAKAVMERQLTDGMDWMDAVILFVKALNIERAKDEVRANGLASGT